MAKKLNTVNVIEYFYGTIQGVTAFPDTPAGNKEAEKIFISLIKKYHPNELQLEYWLEEGYFIGASGYDLYLVHSS